MKAIELIGINKHFPGIEALKDIHFSVRENTVHGFLGPNGAGKSTTMKIITGLILPSNGQVSILGKPLHENLKELKSIIGYLPELPPLYQDMKVIDYLKFVGKIHGLHGNDLKRNLERVVDKIGLNSVRNRYIEVLSKGYKQRVGLAQALIYDPKVLVLDEPTNGLDPQAITEMRMLINELKKSHTILLSTHLLAEANLMCDDITIINRGKILATGSLEDVMGQYQSKQIILARLRNWDNKNERPLLQNHFVDRIDVEEIGDEFQVKIHLKGGDDNRDKVSQALVNGGCGLLQFTQQDIKLEDLFLQLTNRG